MLTEMYCDELIIVKFYTRTETVFYGDKYENVLDTATSIQNRLSNIP